MGGPAGYMVAQPAIWWANPIQTLPQGLVLTLTLTLTLSLTKNVTFCRQEPFPKVMFIVKNIKWILLKFLNFVML